LLFILADSAEPINQTLKRPKDRMKERALALEDPVHERTNGLRKNQNQQKINYD
jgi:hypothetical protein